MIDTINKDFIRIEDIYSFIHKNQKHLRSEGISINTHQNDWGDKYHSESDYHFEIRLLNRTFHIGYVHITEDSDDWAQAEAYNYDYLHEIIGEQEIQHKDGKELYQLLINYKQLKRDSLLSKLI